MSKTLFWYVFSNLLRLFLLTTAGLAGIMCFAGLLRPLTENGLDMGQVNRLLLYMMPAMCTYSLPVSALFAATMVYGRIAADNEFTAMRAGGISYLSPRRFSIALPALVLGLLVATFSLLMLCFVVPFFTLKVEEVISANIAKVIASRIERDHEVDFNGGMMDDSVPVFAQSARLLPPDPRNPDLQSVELTGPVIATQGQSDPSLPNAKIPGEFWMARRAVVTVRRSPQSAAWGAAEIYVQLDHGVRFPRLVANGAQVGVEATSFGPQEIPSAIKQDVKFMDVTHLREQLANPALNEKVTSVIDRLSKREERRVFYADAAKHFDGSATAGYDFSQDPDTHDDFRIGGTGATASYNQDQSELIIRAQPQGGNPRSVYLVQKSGSQEIFVAHATQIHLRATPDVRDAPDPVPNRLTISVTLEDTDIETPQGASEHSSRARTFSIAMPAEIEQVQMKSPEEFLHDPVLDVGERRQLYHEQVVVINAVTSELHGRASFALSCLTLVMVGCALGAMFRSGNLLNAFAVSFIPALLCITLIVCGQHAATHVPYDLGSGFHNPLPEALGFIWVGNILVLITAICLTVRLQRR